MDKKEYANIPYSVFRRETPRFRGIFDAVNKILEKNGKYSLEEARNFQEITYHTIKVLNSFMLDTDGNSKTRDSERDENGKEAFVLSHPLKVALLAFELFPNNLKNLSEEESNKLKEVSENPREVAVTAFFHDFIEDVFDGDFTKIDPRSEKSAAEIIIEILLDPSLNIPEDAQHRIWHRIILLTKPPQRNIPRNLQYTEKEITQNYLNHYEKYLTNIASSDDTIAQYIKLVDILQNAQSEKKGSAIKREEKAKLQANFIFKTFPVLIQKLMKEQPDFFKQLKDKHLLKTLQKFVSKSEIYNIIANQNSSNI